MAEERRLRNTHCTKACLEKTHARPSILKTSGILTNDETLPTELTIDFLIRDNVLRPFFRKSTVISVFTFKPVLLLARKSHISFNQRTAGSYNAIEFHTDS